MNEQERKTLCVLSEVVCSCTPAYTRSNDPNRNLLRPEKDNEGQPNEQNEQAL